MTAQQRHAEPCMTEAFKQITARGHRVAEVAAQLRRRMDLVAGQGTLR